MFDNGGNKVHEIASKLGCRVCRWKLKLKIVQVLLADWFLVNNESLYLTTRERGARKRNKRIQERFLRWYIVRFEGNRISFPLLSFLPKILILELSRNLGIPRFLFFSFIGSLSKIVKFVSPVGMDFAHKFSRTINSISQNSMATRPHISSRLIGKPGTGSCVVNLAIINSGELHQNSYDLANFLRDINSLLLDCSLETLYFKVWRNEILEKN